MTAAHGGDDYVHRLDGRLNLRSRALLLAVLVLGFLILFG